jgi:hypothetical protein
VQYATLGSEPSYTKERTLLWRISKPINRSKLISRYE